MKAAQSRNYFKCYPSCAQDSVDPTKRNPQQSVNTLDHYSSSSHSYKTKKGEFADDILGYFQFFFLTHRQLVSSCLVKPKHTLNMSLEHLQIAVCVFVIFSPFGAAVVMCPFSQWGDDGCPGGGHHARLPAVCVLHHQGESRTRLTAIACMGFE